MDFISAKNILSHNPWELANMLISSRAKDFLFNFMPRPRKSETEMLKNFYDIS